MLISLHLVHSDVVKIYYQKNLPTGRYALELFYVSLNTDIRSGLSKIFIHHPNGNTGLET